VKKKDPFSSGPFNTKRQSILVRLNSNIGAGVAYYSDIWNITQSLDTPIIWAVVNN
jgi:hypothetical protein